MEGVRDVRREADEVEQQCCGRGGLSMRRQVLLPHPCGARRIGQCLGAIRASVRQCLCLHMGLIALRVSRVSDCLTEFM